MKRPTVTEEMIEQAAQKLALNNEWNEDNVADIVKFYRINMDGYELAKRLESHAGWDITVFDVDALDCIDSVVHDILRMAGLQWEKECDIQPPLPVGTMTTRGEITGIYEHEAACYLIRENGETDESRRLIVRFEDACVA